MMLTLLPMATIIASAAYHTWNSATPPTVADGDVVTLANGASGTLTVPAGATVTIDGTAAQSDTINIYFAGANSIVRWNADLTNTGGNTGVNLTSNGNIVWSFYVESGTISTVAVEPRAAVFYGTTPNSVGTIYVTGGAVRNSGTGHAIRASCGVQVTGGTVSALEGNAIAHTVSATTVPIVINGGSVFAYGSAITGGSNVIGINTPANLSIGFSAVVTAWNRGAGVTTYETGSKMHLTVQPATATAAWGTSGSAAGISYLNSANTGFIPIPSVTIVTTGIIDIGANNANITTSNWSCDATGNNYTIINDTAVFGSRTGSSVTTTLEIPAGVTLTWDATLTRSTTGAANALNLPGNGTFSMTGGEITASNTSQAISLSGASGGITISGGTVGAPGSNHAINATGTSNSIIISGGDVSSRSYSAIRTEGAGSTVTVSGGTVSNNATSNYPVIHMATAPTSTSTVNVTVSGNGKVQANGTAGNAINTPGSVLVRDNAEVYKRAGNGDAINVSGMYGTVTISGGLVSNASSGNAINISASANTGLNVAVSGGLVSNTGSGDAIDTRGGVSVTGGIVRAVSGNAISTTSQGSNVTVSGGLVFAYGGDVHGTSAAGHYAVRVGGGSPNITSPGLAVVWNDIPRTGLYLAGSALDISVAPASATAAWGHSGEDHGIEYTSGTNTGFIKLPVTVNVTASNNAVLTIVLTRPVSPGSGTGVQGDPLAATIDVFNAVGTVGRAYITVSLGATFNLYTNPDFTGEVTGSDTIPLIAGGATTVYIKVTAQDEVTTNYFAVTINRSAAGVINIAEDNSGKSGDGWSYNASTRTYTITGNVNIIGTANVTNYISLSIAPDIKATWNAELTSASLSGALDIAGGGEFIMESGTVVSTGNSSAACIDVTDNNSTDVTVNGGVISSANGNAINGRGNVTVNGGVVTSTGNGRAITFDRSNNSLTINGGIVSAATGFAVYNPYALTTPVTINGGLVFAFGTGITATNFSSTNHVIYMSAAASLTITAPGTVVAWNQAASAGNMPYASGTTVDLTVAPEGGAAAWALQGGAGGVSYPGGFCAISGATVYQSKNDASSNIAFNPGSRTYTGGELDCTPASIGGAGFTAGANPSWTYTYAVASGDSGNAALGLNNKPLRAGTYTVTATYEDDDNYGTATGTFTVTQRPLTVSLTVSNKVYDGTDSATFNGMTGIVGVVAGDTVTFSSGIPTFSSTNAANNIPINFTAFSIGGADAGNYSLTQPTGLTANITPKPLIAFVATIGSKTYDGTTAATVTGVTFFAGDMVPTLGTGFTATGAFDSAGAGSGKTVTVTVTLTDTNYSLATNTYQLTGQSIARATGLTAPDPAPVPIISSVTTPQMYWLSDLMVSFNKPDTGPFYTTLGDFTDSSGILTAQPVLDGTAHTLTYTGTGKTTGAATQIINIETGNYQTITVTITFNAVDVIPLTITGITVNNKTYDGNTTATFSGAAALVRTNVQGSDQVNLTGTPVITFSDKGVGSGKAVTISGLTLTGNDAYKYTLDLSGFAANITQRTLTVDAMMSDKVYDGGNAAGVIYANLVGVIGGDTVNRLIGTPTFSSVNAGNNIPINTDFSISGTDAANYTLTQPTLTASIYKAPAPALTWPTAGTITYGAPLSSSNLTGGSTTLGSFAWTDPATIPTVTNSGYGVTFTPSAAAVMNYEPITPLTNTVSITVNKATVSAGLNNINHDYEVLTNLAKSDYSYDLTRLLPNLSPRSLGNVTYTVASVTNSSGVLATVPSGVVTSPLTFGVADVSGVGLQAVITVTVSSENYNDFTATITVETTDRTPVTIAATASGGTYNGQPRGYTGTPAVTSNIDGSAVTGITLDVLYESTDGAGYSSATAPTNAGAYKLTLSVPASDPSYIGHEVFTFTISKATVTIRVNNATVTTGQAAPAFVFTPTGLASGETLAAAPVFATTYTTSSPAGTYEIVPSGAAVPNTDNYEAVIIYLNGTLTANAPSTGGGGGYTPPTTTPMPTDTPVNPDGHDITTPDGKPPIKNDDGSHTLPGGGTITKPGNGDSFNVGLTIDVPPGTVISDNGSISFPKGSGGGTITYDSGLSFSIHEDAIIILDSGVPLGYFIGFDNPYGDVKAGDWFYNHVMFAYTHGLMSGTSASPMMFSPNMATTRGMLVTILYRLEGSPNVSVLPTPFTDNPASEWYADAVKWAAANGIASGYGNGIFGAGDNINREQMAVMLANYIKYKGFEMPAGQTAAFNDESEISVWAIDGIRLLQSAGVIGGKPGGLLDPKGNATRAEAATMLMRFLEATDEE